MRLALSKLSNDKDRSMNSRSLLMNGSEKKFPPKLSKRLDLRRKTLPSVKLPQIPDSRPARPECKDEDEHEDIVSASLMKHKQTQPKCKPEIDSPLNNRFLYLKASSFSEAVAGNVCRKELSRFLDPGAPSEQIEEVVTRRTRKHKTWNRLQQQHWKVVKFHS